MPNATLSSTLGSRGHAHNTAPTRFVEADDIRFAYPTTRYVQAPPSLGQHPQ